MPAQAGERGSSRSPRLPAKVLIEGLSGWLAGWLGWLAWPAGLAGWLAACLPGCLPGSPDLPAWLPA